MGRKSQLKITENQLKRYLLNHFIDGNGNKVSVRDIFTSLDFMKYTGLYNHQSMSLELQPISLGTMTYWLKKLELREPELFKYYKKKGLIKEKVEFKDWSRKCNRRGKINYTTQQSDFKYRFIDHFNLDAVECYGLSLDELKEQAIELYETMGHSIGEFLEDFESFKEILEVSDRALIENRHINRSTSE